jgi:hypothetical protein
MVDGELMPKAHIDSPFRRGAAAGVAKVEAQPANRSRALKAPMVAR